MSELHLKQPQFTYRACGSFTKHLERIQKFIRTGNLKYLYKNKLDKVGFAHDAAYSDSKDLDKRTISDKILKDRAYDIARNHKYDGYERAFARMVYKFSERKTGSGLIVTSKIGVNINEKLAKDLCKPVIRKFKRRKVYTRFKDNIWAANLSEMGSLSSMNKNVKNLLCTIDVFTKYPLAKHLKEKNVKQFLILLLK